MILAKNGYRKATGPNVPSYPSPVPMAQTYRTDCGIYNIFHGYTAPSQLHIL